MTKVIPRRVRRYAIVAVLVQDTFRINYKRNISFRSPYGFYSAIRTYIFSG